MSAETENCVHEIKISISVVVGKRNVQSINPTVTPAKCLHIT